MGEMKRSALASWSVALLTTGLIACDNSDDSDDSDESKAEETAETAPNGSHVALSGTVSQSSADKFVLDYGGGTITVEMDDWDWYAEGHQLLENDEVVVHGYVDDDFYEKRTIEASSVYVSDVGTQFYASGVDEEDFPVITTAVGTKPQIQIRGTVKEVKVDEFKLDTGAGVIDVATNEMPYDPLDKEGFQRIQPNDRVSVRGSFGYQFFNDLDLIADQVVTLKKSTAPKKG